jgi:hypothetical protein
VPARMRQSDGLRRMQTFCISYAGEISLAGKEVALVLSVKIGGIDRTAKVGDEYPVARHVEGDNAPRRLRLPCLGNSQTNDPLRTRPGRPLVNRRSAVSSHENGSACAGVVPVYKFRDGLDLIFSDQSRCMPAVLNRVDTHITIPAYHVLENRFRE